MRRPLVSLGAVKVVFRPADPDGRQPPLSSLRSVFISASSVVRYLQLAGIEATRLSATGYADTRPLADNADERGRASNRRVELVMQTEPDKP